MPRFLHPLLVTVAVLAPVAFGVGCAMDGESFPEATEVDPSLRVRTSPDDVAAQFVGDQACARCHARQFKEHVASNHALTLRPMRRERLPKDFPACANFTDTRTGTSYTLTEAAGRFALTARAGGKDRTQEVDLALGSGKRGMTFLALQQPESMIELRLSCFPRRNEWFVTPGQNGPDPHPLGVQHTGKMAQRCLGCHSTVVPASRAFPEERFMGVGCESCHGPGQDHVAAATAGRKPLEIERLRDRGAKEINELCGECHRTANDINADDGISITMTQRFQPYGLMKSACFLESDDRLSCVTCHNPHTNSETRPAAYERACLSCHSPAKKQTVCPVNQRSGCVGCHMPQREVIPGISMADHWIRVFPRSAQRAAADSRNKSLPRALLALARSHR
jgi:hypothetical protein